MSQRDICIPSCVFYTYISLDYRAQLWNGGTVLLVPWGSHSILHFRAEVFSPTSPCSTSLLDCLLDKRAKAKSLLQRQAMQALCLCFFFKKHQKIEQNLALVATSVFQAAPVACKPREALGQQDRLSFGGITQPRQSYYRRPIIVFSPSRIWKRNQCG